MDALREMFKNVTGEFQGNINELKAAADAKNIGGVFGALSKLIENVARAIEKVADGMKQAGHVINGQEKHEVVRDLILDLAVGPINKAIDIPFLSEEAEAALFRRILGKAIDGMIKKAVTKFNSTGWNLS